MLQGFENIIKAIKDWSKSKYQPKGDYATTEEIPTKTSDLENDNGFITKVVEDLTNYYKKSDTYTKKEVSALIADINTMQFSVVTELPTENISTSTIYLVPAEDGTTGNIYDEYLYINGEWEVIGNTAIDLSGYLTTTGDSSDTVSSGEAKAGDIKIGIAEDADGYPYIDLTYPEMLRLKFEGILRYFNALRNFIYEKVIVKIPSLTNNLLATEQGTALDATQGKVLNDKIEVNSDAISQINSDLATNTIVVNNKSSYFVEGGSVSVTFVKIGKVVTFNGTITTGSEVSTNINSPLFFLPYQAINEFGGIIIEGSSIDTINYYCNMGAIYTRVALKVNFTYGIVGSYITSS